MQFDDLGRAVTAPFATPGAIATLYERGIVVAGGDGVVTARFGFARDGGPAVAVAGDLPVVIGDPIELRLGGWHPAALETALRWALRGRLALRESGTRGAIVPVELGALELDDGGRVLVRCRARVAHQRLDDVLVRGDHGWAVIARGAVYGRAASDAATVAVRTPPPTAIRTIGLRDLIGG